MRILTILLATALLAGCGYKLGEIRPTSMRSVRTLAVPTFKNKTYEPRIEVMFADTTIKQFQQDGTYTITSDNNADAILYGTITRVEKRPLRSQTNNVLATSEFELQVDVTYEVVDRVTGVQLLTGRAHGETTFFTSPDLQSDERQALPLAAQDMAVQLVTDVSEGW